MTGKAFQYMYFVYEVYGLLFSLLLQHGSRGKTQLSRKKERAHHEETASPVLLLIIFSLCFFSADKCRVQQAGTNFASSLQTPHSSICVRNKQAILSFAR